MGRHKSFDVDAVLDVIVRGFSSSGYSATSMRDLATVTQLELGSLYNAFGDKQAIFRATLDRQFSTFWDPLLVESASASRTIHVHYSRLTRQLVAGPVVAGGLLAVGIVESPVHQAVIREKLLGQLETVFNFYKHQMQRLGSEGKRTGLSVRSRRRATATQAAQEMLGATMGMLVLARLGNQSAAVRAIAAGAIRHAL